MDTPPDPHLSKALAHAPDHQAAPPAHLSAQILAAAHRQAAAAPPEPPRAALPWWRRPWGASGALATVLMAGFIGLLWRGEPPGPAVDGPAPAAQRVNEAQMAATAPPSADPAPAALPPLLRPSPAPAAAPAKKAAERAAAASPAERPRANVEQARAEQFAKPAPAAEAAQEPPAPPPAAAGRVADQALAEAQPAPPPASPAPPLLRAHSAARAPAPLSAPTAAAVAGTPALRMATTSLPAWRQGDDLAWEPGSPMAVPDAAWLQQLAALTQGHWVKAASAPPAGARLRWLRQGAPLGTLQWETGVVWWCAAGQACLSAPVPPAALEALAGELASKR